MTKRRAPRPFAEALRATRTGLEPATPLARAQAAWAEAVGERIAAVTRVRGERDGTLTVACESAVWAQELDLLQAEILERLNAVLGADAPVRELRFENA